MITTRTRDRLDGVDHTGERWAAHLVPADPAQGEPLLVAVRVLDGKLLLGVDDAQQLASWIRCAVPSSR